MPFLSRSQMSKCYATNGFNGKVNCDEWAHATKNIKSLPDKKEMGGQHMKYRGKKKYQLGGFPQQRNYPDYESYIQAVEEYRKQNGMYSPQPMDTQYGKQLSKEEQNYIATGQTQVPVTRNTSNNVQEINGFPKDQQFLPSNAINVSDNGQWNPANTGQESPNYTWAGAKRNPTTQKNEFDYRGLGAGIQAARTGLGFISGAVERGSQNKYMYNQFTTMGQMNPMPVQDYQPSPYSLYARYGGSLKKWQTGGLYTSQSQINAADREAARFAESKNLPFGVGTRTGRRVGDAMVPYVDSSTGLPFIPSPVDQKAYSVPQDVQASDIQNEQGQYFYNDPHTGELKIVDPNVLNSSRFRKPPQQVATDIAMRTSDLARFKRGGIHMKKRDPKEGTKADRIEDMKTMEREAPESMSKYRDGGKWIQKATAHMRTDHPCTGSKFGGPSCRPGTRRYALAKTFKAMHH